MKNEILILGIIKDGEKTLEKEVKNIQNSFLSFNKIHWFVVESDSSDKTTKVLEKLNSLNENFNYASLGDLSNDIPGRLERIAYCRNLCLEEMNSSNKYKKCQYVVVADLDGVNNLLTKNSVESCWEVNKNWDMCSANQKGPYYDISALRHQKWCPNDCWQDYSNFLKDGISEEESLSKAVLSKMISIPESEDFIEVLSSFGGLAIYKRKYLELSSYGHLDENKNEVCEHVILHKKMIENGAKLYINPKLINGGLNEHSKQILLRYKIWRKMKNFLKTILKKLT